MADTTLARRDLGDAQKAYELNDIEASVKAHGEKVHTEHHSKHGDKIKSIVYGGLDGIITTFAVVAGATGGGLDVHTILILGFSNIFADALSMGVGDALSTKAENEFILGEKMREEWEMKNNPEGEIDEMVDLYVEKGMSKEDAQECIERMAKYPGFFVNVMMNEELELQVPDPDDSPWKSGFVTFSAFVVFGVVPLLGYIILHTFLQDMPNAMDILFGVACGLTGVMLFLLGALKTRFTRQKWYVGGGEIFLLGGACAATAYLIGMLIEVVLAGQGKTVHVCNNMTLYPNGSVVPAL